MASAAIAVSLGAASASGLTSGSGRSVASWLVRVSGPSGSSGLTAVSRLSAAVPPASHSGHELAVVLAVVLVAVGGLILLGLGLRRRLNGGFSGVVLADAPAPRRSVQRAAAAFAALLSVASALLCGSAFASAPAAQARTLDAAAGFLIVAALVQTGFAVGILVSQRRGLVLAGIAINAILVTVWLARLVGPAASGGAGRAAIPGSAPSAVAPAETAAAVFAMLLMAVLAWLAYGIPSLTRDRAQQLRSAISIAAVPSVGIVVLATLLVISGGSAGQIPA